MKDLQYVFDAVVVPSSSMNVFEGCFHIVREIVSRWKSRTDTLDNYNAVFEMLLRCMDIRIMSATNTEKQTAEKEFIVVDSFRSLILKLTDSEMNDLMTRMVQWVDDFQRGSPQYNIRTMVLFRLIHLCLKKFKDAFCPMAI